jgi:hypothetical protein
MMLGHLAGVLTVAMLLLRTKRAVALLAGTYLLVFVAYMVGINL